MTLSRTRKSPKRRRALPELLEALARAINALEHEAAYQGHLLSTLSKRDRAAGHTRGALYGLELALSLVRKAFRLPSPTHPPKEKARP